jgi:uncharacterized membrane protein
MDISPNDPSWQHAFDDFFLHYFLYSIFFFVLVLAISIVLTKLARRAKNKFTAKKIYLGRKLFLYVTIICWAVLTGIITGFIPIGR